MRLENLTAGQRLATDVHVSIVFRYRKHDWGEAEYQGQYETLFSPRWLQLVAQRYARVAMLTLPELVAGCKLTMVEAQDRMV